MHTDLFQAAQCAVRQRRQQLPNGLVAHPQLAQLRPQAEGLSRVQVGRSLRGSAPWARRVEQLLQPTRLGQGNRVRVHLRGAAGPGPPQDQPKKVSSSRRLVLPLRPRRLLPWAWNLAHCLRPSRCCDRCCGRETRLERCIHLIRQRDCLLQLVRSALAR